MNVDVGVENPPHVLIEVFDAKADSFLQELQLFGLSAAIDPDSDASLERWLNSARAVLLVVGPRRLALVKDRVDIIWRRIIDAGVNLLIAVPRDDINVYSLWLKDLLKNFDLRSSQVGGLASATVSVVIAEPRGIARSIALRECSRPPSKSLIIRPQSTSIKHRVLFQRAFNDYHSVELSKLTPGKTASVYRIDAVRVPAIRPLPFLAKIAVRRKIAVEYDNFVDNVADFVPFPSRPNLIRERCLVGAEYGILVGQFIEHSEPLADVMMRTTWPQVLHNVFENLLRGWWRQGEFASSGLLSGLEDWVEYPGKPSRDKALNKNYISAAANDGSLMEPTVLRAKLNALAQCRHKRSVIHGDMHARNIHVSGTDPFLIDFGSVVQGPILADAAMLEASLVLTAGAACESPSSLKSWKAVTRRHLYARGWNTRPPDRTPPIRLQGPIRRLWDAVRVIRLHARGMEASPNEYAVLMSAAFIRLASFDERPRLRTQCATHLYAVACQIVAGIA